MANKEFIFAFRTSIQSQQNFSEEKGNCIDNEFITPFESMKKFLKQLFDMS